MSDLCDLTEVPTATCGHCNPPAATPPAGSRTGDKADSKDARALFRKLVLEVRPGASVRDPGTAMQVSVDGTKVWVKATLAEDASTESYQFHDAAVMLAVEVEHLALVNLRVGSVHLISKAAADAEARRQLQTHPAGRIALKLTSPQVAPHLHSLTEVFGRQP